MQWDWAVEMKISYRKYFYVTQRVFAKVKHHCYLLTAQEISHIESQCHGGLVRCFFRSFFAQ